MKGIHAPAGVYIVTVTGIQSGCSNTAEVTIEDIHIELNAEINPAGCGGGGSIWVFPEYSHDFISDDNLRYEWSNGATTDFIDDLIPGIYCVTVSYGINGYCSVSKCFEVVEPERDEYVKVNSIMHNCICTDGSIGCNGLINLRLNGAGLYNIAYMWYDENNTLISEMARIHSLCSGVYRLEVRYSKVGVPGECLITEYFNINSENCNNGNIVKLNEILQNENCGVFNNCSGLIDISINAGVYTEISWTGPDNFTSLSPRIENLCPGVYTLKVYSPDGCFSTSASYLICCCNSNVTDNGQPQTASCFHEGYIPIRFIGDVQNATNATSSDGSIRLIFFGNGIGNLSIHWIGPNGYTGQGAVITELKPGEYEVKVSDGCKTLNRTFIVGDKEKCANLNIRLSLESTCAFGESLACRLEPHIQGGTHPYLYNWSDGSTNKIIYSQINRTFSLTVTDSNGCTNVGLGEINKTYTPLQIEMTIQNPDGCDDFINDVLVTVRVLSGNPPYRIAETFGNY